MSLEDKAKEIKEYLDCIVSEYERGQGSNEDIGRFMELVYKYGKEHRKQALKDMMERAEELQLPYLRMYKKIAEGLEGK